MVDDEQVRSYLRTIAPGGALESANASEAVAVVPENIGTPQQRDDARSAAVKLSRRQALQPHERFAFEAIVIPDKRPATFIIGGDYTLTHELWLHLNGDEYKQRLRPTFSSIGRIELPEHPSLPYGGTGFVVGPKLLMTNRHVAEIFANGLGRQITFKPGLKAGVDFLQERNTPPQNAVRIDVRRVVMIHPYWDMALLEVDGFDAQHPTLVLTARAPEDFLADRTRRAEIAVVGYPAFDPRNNADVQNQVFGGVYNVKRFQPGLLQPRAQIDSFDKQVNAATHDASTLGGNSGSAVIDTGTGQIVALHFAGRYLEANYAVPTSDLAQDPRVVDAGVNFKPAPARGADTYKRWWDETEGEAAPKNAGDGMKPPSIQSTPPAAAPRGGGAVTITIPLRITVDLGDPVPAEPPAAASARAEAFVAAEADQAPQASVAPAPAPARARDAQALAHGPKTFRDPFLSIYQSIAEDVARNTTKAESLTSQPDPGVVLAAERVASIRHSGRTEVPANVSAFEALTLVEQGSRCASLAYQMTRAAMFGDEATQARLKGEMEAGKCDPRWITTITEYKKYFGVFGVHPQPLYVKPTQAGEGALPMKAGCRIGVISDWATGAEPARRLLGLVKAQAPDLLIHLGDIYYSGTPDECAIKFENEMAAVFGPKETRVPIFTLAGNHDMYCGGVGYYDLIPRLNKAPLVQPASFFCLRATDASWQVLAMDTGQHDYSPIDVDNAVTFVEADEQAWLKRRLDEFHGRTILMSHHQLFSAFSQIGPKDAQGRPNPVNPALLDMFERFGDSRSRVAAWFWGHEHNLCIYRPFIGLERGRCVGHSGVPVFVEDDPYEVLDGLRSPPPLVADTKLSDDGSYFRHGFAMLTLRAGSTGTADYFEDRDGVAVRTHSETL